MIEILHTAYKCEHCGRIFISRYEHDEKRCLEYIQMQQKFQRDYEAACVKAAQVGAENKQELVEASLEPPNKYGDTRLRDLASDLVDEHIHRDFGCSSMNEHLIALVLRGAGL